MKLEVKVRRLAVLTSVFMAGALIAGCAPSKVENVTAAPDSKQAKIDNCIQNMSLDILNDCAVLNPNPQLVFDELKKVIKTGNITSELEQRLEDPIDLAEKLELNGRAVIYNHWYDGGTADMFHGCDRGKFIDFKSTLVLPKLVGNDLNNPGNVALTSAWHEIDHEYLAYLRFRNGQSCPFPSPESEEYEVSFRDAIVNALIDDNQELSKKYVFEDWKTQGVDLPHVVLNVLIPLKIDSNSKLYQFLWSQALQGRYMFTHSIAWPDYFSEKDKEFVSDSVLEWEKLKNILSSQEKLAIKEMQDKGLVLDGFFPN
jgi:hypothetical protein